MTYRNILLGSLAALLMVSPALRADDAQVSPDPAAVQDVANHLSEFEEQAAKVDRDAENLWLISRDHRTARDGHAYYLNSLRDGVNRLGQFFAELEQMKPQASEAQQMGIENARPHLVVLANKTTEALDLVRARGENIKQSQYKEAVSELSRQADILHQTVDTIRDYGDAEDRLGKLEASHGDSN